MELSIVKAGIASIWLLTGLLVLHPYYREVGGAYLDRLGLPHGSMTAACAGEVVLGLRVLIGRMTFALAVFQAALILGFSAILVLLEPMLLVHPFGILTKNVPLLAMIAAAADVERGGWTARADRLLRGGLAAIWAAEGLLPKIFFVQPMEIAVVERSRLVSMDPSLFLVAMGVVEALSGLAVLVLDGRTLRVVLAAQIFGLVLLPILVAWHEPTLWVHPFGPLTKNLPILAATVVLFRRNGAAGGRDYSLSL